jgi:tripartite-type tricarboxylate transporter receptor subunit TctC
MLLCHERRCAAWPAPLSFSLIIDWETSMREINLKFLSRRRLLIGGCGAAWGSTLLSTAFGAPSTARWKPRHPITVLNPAPPGGALDLQLRFLAERAGRVLGQPIIVENKPGASTTLAGALVVGAKPDGNKLAVVLANSFRYPYYEKVAWNPLRDFDYITGLGAFALGVIVKSDSPWRSIEELIAAGKSAAGKLSYGTGGQGTTGHLLMLDIERTVHAEFMHVPYKGGPETSRALLSREVDFIVEAGAPFAQVDAGAFRVLAFATEKPLSRYPGVPTLRERGIDLVGWSGYGLVGPKGLPDDVIETLGAAFKDAAKDPAYQELLDRLVLTTWSIDSKQYRQWAESYTKSVKPQLIRAGLVTR